MTGNVVEYKAKQIEQIKYLTISIYPSLLSLLVLDLMVLVVDCVAIGDVVVVVVVVVAAAVVVVVVVVHVTVNH